MLDLTWSMDWKSDSLFEFEKEAVLEKKHLSAT